MRKQMWRAVFTRSDSSETIAKFPTYAGARAWVARMLEVTPGLCYGTITECAP